MKKTSNIICIATVIIVATMSIGAEERKVPVSYQAGVHYTVLKNPVEPINPEMIEITEIFWYGCPHCFNMEKNLEEWEKKDSEKIAFYLDHAVWNRITEIHAKAFYSTQELGIHDTVHSKLFTEIHENDNPLRSEEQLADFLAQFGVNKSAFDQAFNSAYVSSRIENRDKIDSYEIRRVPTFIVNGKYSVSANPNLPDDEVLSVVDFLIDQETE